ELAELRLVFEEVVEMVRRLNRASVHPLELRRLGVVGLLARLQGVPDAGIAREKHVDRLFELAGNVELQLCVRAAREARRSLRGLGAEEMPDDVDHGVGVLELSSKHLLDGAIVGREARLVLGEGALLLNLDLNRIAKRTELRRHATEKDGRPRFHVSSIPRG